MIMVQKKRSDTMNEKLIKLNKIFRESISKGSRIIIYALNDISLEIKWILESLYSYSPIVIDDDLSRFNDYIISFEEYKKIYKKGDTVIICSSSPTQTQQIAVKLRELNIVIKDKNVITWPNGYYPEKEKYFKDLKKLLTVKKAVGYDLKRFGRNNDGGYCMLNDIQKCSIAYSFGICDDISWDEYIADNNVEVYCYDHTIDALPHENSHLHFRKIGIGAEDDLRAGLLSFDSILKLNGHRKESGMILKMDVEGAEWSVIRDVPQDILSLFSQIIFEFHHVSTPFFLNFQESLSVFEKLNRTHQVIWIHANNFDVAEELDGITIPNTLEITYASKCEYKFEQTEYSCPLSIDEPNYRIKSDIELKNFGDIQTEVENNESITTEAIWIGYFYETQTLSGVAFFSQLFIDDGTGFTENMKILASYNAFDNKECFVRFNISDFQNIKMLRFDPIEGYFCEVEILSAVSEYGEIELVPDVCVRRGNKAIFLNTDPQYYIYSQFHTFVEIRFRLRFLSAFESEQNVCEYYRAQENYRVLKEAEIKSQSTKISEQDAIIDSQNAKLSEQSSVIDNQNVKLIKQDAIIDSHNAKLSDQISVIDSQNVKLSEQDAIIDSQNAKFSEQDSIIDSQNAIIEKQASEIEKKDGIVNEQNSII